MSDTQTRTVTQGEAGIIMAQVANMDEFPIIETNGWQHQYSRYNHSTGYAYVTELVDGDDVIDWITTWQNRGWEVKHIKHTLTATVTMSVESWNKLDEMEAQGITACLYYP